MIWRAQTDWNFFKYVLFLFLCVIRHLRVGYSPVRGGGGGGVVGWLVPRVCDGRVLFWRRCVSQKPRKCSGRFCARYFTLNLENKEVCKHESLL